MRSKSKANQILEVLKSNEPKEEKVKKIIELGLPANLISNQKSKKLKMCVIIVKDAGVAMPADDILQAAAHCNPHGFGFCAPRLLCRSLSFGRFMDELRKVRAVEPCIIHFRLATTGSVKPSNCHPFVESGVCFAHNGVLSIAVKNDMTDSETFFLHGVMPVIERHGMCSDALARFMLQNGGGSKFALMRRRTGKIRLFGAFAEMRGCMYSNLRFMRLAGFSGYGTAPDA